MIFADVKLQARDDVATLLSRGLRLMARGGSPVNATTAARGLKFTQPCAAFCEGRCRIYSDRPQYCRKFECLLLKRLKGGGVTREQALRTISQTQRQADEVFRLLQQLGDTDEQKALATRLRETSKRLLKANVDKETASLYGQLTVAVQKLHCALSESFYPG